MILYTQNNVKEAVKNCTKITLFTQNVICAKIM